MTLAADILTDLEGIMDDWGDTGAYAGAAAVSGIFDNEYVVELDTGTTAPVFLYKTTDIPAAAKGGVIVITSTLWNVSAVSYTVLERQTDPQDAGPGTTRLVLKKTL